MKVLEFVLRVFAVDLIFNIIVGGAPRIVQDSDLVQQLLPLVIHLIVHLLENLLPSEKNAIE